MMKTTVFYALATVLLLCSCNEAKETPSVQEQIIPVRTESIEKAEIRPKFYVSGLFSTDDESDLSFKNGGIIQAVYVEEGDAVIKGQILASLDMTEINTLTEQAEIALVKAERDAERAENLYRDSVVTLEQMQNAQTALEIARQQVENARYNSDQSVLKASQSGYVLKKFFRAGQVVGPGMPIVRINGASESPWVLKAGVSDQQWAAIRPGDPAEITTDVFPGKVLRGEVTRKSEGTNPMTGTLSLTISLKDSAPGLAAGLFGKAVIQSSLRDSVWRIPFHALLDEDENRGFVFAPDGARSVRKIPVVIDRLENGNVLISSGLEGTDQIIVEGNAYLNEDSEIEILP